MLDGHRFLRGYGYADYHAVLVSVGTAVTDHVLFTAMERDYVLIDVVAQVEKTIDIADWRNPIDIGTLAVPAKFLEFFPKTTGGTAGTAYSLFRKDAAAAWRAGGFTWAATADTPAERVIPKGTAVVVNYVNSAGTGRVVVGLLLKPRGPLEMPARVRE